MANIAFVSPLPPAETGIATYSAAVLEGLRRIGFSERHRLDRVWPIGREDRDRVRQADVGVYHIGNNVEFHGDIYTLSVWNPGIVVLHDLALDGLMGGLTLTRSPLASPARREAFSKVGRPYLPLEESVIDDPLEIPWCAQVVRRARAVIVHSGFARDYLQAFGCLTPVFVAPHPIVEREEDVTTAIHLGKTLRSRLDRPSDEVLIGVAGHLNEAKGIVEVLDAFRRIRHPVRLLLLGRLSEYLDVQVVIRRSGLANRVTVVANAPDDEFLAWLSACDVVVNLRYPHRGETSGSLLRALQIGLPAVVSATGSYREWPDDAVVKIPSGQPSPKQLAAALDDLIEHPDARRTIGARARRYVLEACSEEATARVYERAIEETMSLTANLRERALARWSRSLVECGANVDSARMGHGLRFAQAVVELGAGGTR